MSSNTEKRLSLLSKRWAVRHATTLPPRISYQHQPLFTQDILNGKNGEMVVHFTGDMKAEDRAARMREVLASLVSEARATEGLLYPPKVEVVRLYYDELRKLCKFQFSPTCAAEPSDEA